MKEMLLRLFPVPFLMILLLALPGCDQGSSWHELIITPEEVELSYNGEAVRLTVSEGLRELSEPLTWSVSNPNLGFIVVEEGVHAEYTRTGAGINVVIVEDQYGAEGFATITSPSSQSGSSSSGYNITLAANPSQTIPIGVTTVSITAINGQAPYTWSVGDSSKGSVPAETDDTITYTSSDTGDNTVICVDANGARGTIVITQE